MTEGYDKKAGAGGQTISLTVGTAGHIDHGKTSLVKFLTGCDCDTLPEEKARGMTIDLGFATCVLPNNRRVGIVDVPGHERFIHNMVAGATGIDVVMLVVAADDGVMPQTIEHFHIVRLLGITSGMVAVTKIDMVSQERVAEVVEQVKHLVQGSFLEGCTIAPVSSKTGAGFAGFYDAFVATVDKTAHRNSSGAFRMHIERSFVMQGIGSVISGIPRSGSVRVGDELDMLPNGGRKRVRGVQVYGEDAEVGKAGECIALKLNDANRDEMKRGMVLVTPGYFEPTRFVNARFYSMPGLDKPLKPRCGIKFHIGTTEATGYLVLPDLTPLAPGSETYVQLQLNEPVVAAPGDFFVVRLLSPVKTIGGGTVVSGENSKMRRSKGNWTETVKHREEAFSDPLKGMEYVLENSGGVPLHVPELARKALVNEDAAKQHLAKLVAEGSIAEIHGARYIHSRFLVAAGEELLSVLGKMHDAKPLSVGFSKKDVFRELKSDHALVEKALERLLYSGAIKANETGLQIPSRAPQLTQKQATLGARLMETFRKTGFASPRRDELPQLLGIPSGLIDPVLNHLLQTGEVVELSDKVILHKDLVEQSKAKLVEYLAQHGSIEPGQAKDVLGTTRKYAIPLLEYWDAKGLTRRVGNGRVLK
jgi:selenocysteine-specific elongation factor